LRLDTWEHLQFDTFPPEGVHQSVLYLAGAADSTGTLSGEAPESPALQKLVHTYREGFTLSALFEANVPLRGPDGVLTHFARDSLAFEMPPLVADLLVVGIPSFELFVEGTASRFQVNVGLWDVDPVSRRRRLFSRGTVMVDGESHTPDSPVATDLAAIAYRIPAGHVLRLEVSNLDLDWNADRNAWRRIWATPHFEQNELALHTGGDTPSRVTIPILTPRE